MLYSWFWWCYLSFHPSVSTCFFSFHLDKKNNSQNTINLIKKRFSSWSRRISCSTHKNKLQQRETEADSVNKWWHTWSTGHNSSLPVKSSKHQICVERWGDVTFLTSTRETNRNIIFPSCFSIISVLCGALLMTSSLHQQFIRLLQPGEHWIDRCRLILELRWSVVALCVVWGRGSQRLINCLNDR